MRSSTQRLFRLSGFVVVILLLAVLMAGCAGGDSSNDDPAPTSDSVANVSGDANPAPPANAEVNTSADSDPAGDANAQAAASPEPTSVPLAATVNGEPISLSEFQRERERRALGMTIEPASSAAFEAQVLQDMVDQALIEQNAAQMGIEVTDAEVDAELATHEQIAGANGQSLDDMIAAQLYTMSEYRDAVASMLLWGKVSERVVANVPETSMQVHSRHILVADEATARDLLRQLDAGADFAQLAIQHSLDGSTAPSGGDLDWVSEGDLLQPEVEDAIFALDAGQRSSEPVRSSLGYHIVETLEKVEGRPLDQATLAERKAQVFLRWLENQRQSATVERFVGAANQ